MLITMHEAKDIARLPLMEQDILHLHMVLRKSQTEIAKILGASQPTVNYRYKRARERLEFMEQIPPVTSEEIKEVLTSLGARDVDIEAMVLYVETSSQSEVARRMGTSQGAVRHWILRALVNHLQNDMREDDMHKRVRTACSLLAGRPGIFNEPNKKKEDTPRISEHKLAAMPKVQGRFLEGERLQILEGLYRGLDGYIVQLDEKTITLEITLKSHTLVLICPR